MKLRSFHTLALMAALTAASLTGCSSSEVQEDSASMPTEDLPVVDANTDALPGSLDGGADGLSPEASIEVPDGQDQEAAALTEQIAATEQTSEALPALSDSPIADGGPALEAPPSLDGPVASEGMESIPSEPLASVSEPAPPELTAPAGSGGDSSYEIQAGDTLMKISYKVYGDIYQWRRIYEDNRDRISDPMRLVTGTSLKTDRPVQEDDFGGYERYLIKNGDTLGSISGDVYGTRSKWRRLWKENDRLIRDPNRIYAGFTIRYTFTEQDRLEHDRSQDLRQNSTPLAGRPESGSREPSTAQAPSSSETEQN